MAKSDTDVSDEALIAGMAIGDEEAGVAFVRRYQRRVYGLALAMVRDPQLAEDIAQEALLRAWRHACVYDHRRASVATWVLTITHNIALDTLRLKRPVAVDPDELLALESAGQNDPEELAVNADSVTHVKRALSRLPKEQQRALVLAAVYGYSAREVSSLEAVPLGTAKTRIRNGLRKLRSLIAEHQSRPGPKGGGQLGD
jgi:RNA polymerase sigma factor (sigma-70 family)